MYNHVLEQKLFVCQPVSVLLSLPAAHTIARREDPCVTGTRVGRRQAAVAVVWEGARVRMPHCVTGTSKPLTAATAASATSKLRHAHSRSEGATPLSTLARTRHLYKRSGGERQEMRRFGGRREEEERERERELGPSVTGESQGRRRWRKEDGGRGGEEEHR